MKRTRFTEEQIIGGLEVSEARRLRELESENAKLKRLLADPLAPQISCEQLTEAVPPGGLPQVRS